MDENRSKSGLVSSLSLLGQLSPILVRKKPQEAGRYEVIFGNRRLAAAKELHWETIEAEIIESTDTQSLMIAFAENCEREDFSDYEKALIIEELHVRTGKSYKEIADDIGKSSAFVSQHVAMLNLFAEEVASREERSRVLQALTEGHTRILGKINDPFERWNTAKLAVKSSFSVRELSKFCARFQQRRKTKENRNDPIDLVRQLIFQKVNGLNTRNPSMFYGSVAKGFTMFSRYPPLSLMDRARAEEHTSDLMRLQQQYDVKIQDLNVKVFDRFAYATVVRLDKFRSSNHTFEVKTRGTIILVRNEQWQILHEHWSSYDPEVLDLYKLKNQKEMHATISKELETRTIFPKRSNANSLPWN
jgi:ParB/RepB/Spo0J family partition protein